MFPELPQWKPKALAGYNILVVGASGGIGIAIVRMLAEQGDVLVGAHYASNDLELKQLEGPNVRLLKKSLSSEADCGMLIDDFVRDRGRIDAVIIAMGGIANPIHFNELSEQEWRNDLFLNLSAPFFISRAAMQSMIKGGNGGRIIFFGTESAPYGGSPYSLAYGVSKLGIECLVKALAREGGRHGVLVNGIRLGYIASGFHERWQKRNAQDMKKRADMVLLKRAGDPKEVAAFAVYLLSGWAGFITGEMFGINGGDRL